jgi:hypothetical protein
LVRVLSGLAATLGLLAAAPLPAEAHPLGPPQQVKLDLVAANQVRLNWRAGAPDDLSWLAFDLGLLPADRIMLDGAIIPDASDASLLRGSPAFTDYLVRRTAVTSQGQPCQPQVTDIHDIAEAGATVVFTCPGAVTDAVVELNLLTDLEATYATIVTGPAGEQASYNGYATTHEWRFDPSAVAAVPQASSASALGPVLTAAAVAVPALAGGTIWLLRSRARRKETVG